MLLTTVVDKGVLLLRVQRRCVIIRDDKGLYFRRAESEITQAATAGCTLTLTLP